MVCSQQEKSQGLKLQIKISKPLLMIICEKKLNLHALELFLPIYPRVLPGNITLFFRELISQ